MGGRLAFAGQFVLILVLGGVLIGTRPGDSVSVTASGPDTAAAVKGPQFKVVFQPEATEQAIRALLDSAHLEIVSGPSAEQMYVLAGATGTQVDAAATLKWLRDAPTIVRFAAPVEP
jgi:hypothetical protein